MDVTMEGMLFIGKIMMLAAILGWSFTLGIWAFCKTFGWAPVNLTVNNHFHE